MKKIIAIPLLTLLAAAILCIGCEIKFGSATEELFITPSVADVLKGHSVAFKAIGGYSYRWSLKEPTWGFLSSGRGPRTVYTSRYDPRESSKSETTLDTQILYLESYIAEAGPGDGTTTNGAITVLATAQAQITHVSRCDTCCDDEDDCDDDD